MNFVNDWGQDVSTTIPIVIQICCPICTFYSFNNFTMYQIYTVMYITCVYVFQKRGRRSGDSTTLLIRCSVGLPCKTTMGQVKVARCRIYLLNTLTRIMKDM